jgi:hypothetical protein
MFYLDLDEIPVLAEKFRFMGHNRFNLFNFKDSEHLELPRENPEKGKSTKEHLLRYLAENGLPEKPAKIMLLTNLNTLGYNFNPVSFFFCFNAQNQPLCAVAEVSNTFREMKPYLIPADKPDTNHFHLNTTKYFYVSPFFEHDAQFDFNLDVPGDKLNIRINNLKDGKKIFISTLTGKKEPLSDGNLLRYFFSFPLITIRIITLIHWNAMKLWIKKVPYRKKDERPDLQQGVFKAYKD